MPVPLSLESKFIRQNLLREAPARQNEPESSNTENIRKLIDSAVSRQSTHTEEIPVFKPELPVEQENKFILLSRSLSGLIDLIVAILCTGVFIISADYFSGIVILDGVSLIEFTGLFLLIYFSYSIHFLATSGQTVGMMITDLRVIGVEGTRPSIGQLFSRCLGYLLSVLVLGAGLFWSLFDRQNLCFHDRFSNTSVIRL
ncbi:MAG: RDD family protein [Acidobacteriota bacterium]